LSAVRTFRWFFWTYNAGVALTASMLITHGSMTVLGHEAGPAIAEIAGMGHILITIGLVLLFLSLKGCLLPKSVEATKTTAVAVPS
jgi:hypothetical protein